MGTTIMPASTSQEYETPNFGFRLFQLATHPMADLGGLLWSGTFCGVPGICVTGLHIVGYAVVACRLGYLRKYRGLSIRHTRAR